MTYKSLLIILDNIPSREEGLIIICWQFIGIFVNSLWFCDTSLNVGSFLTGKYMSISSGKPTHMSEFMPGRVVKKVTNYKCIYLLTHPIDLLQVVCFTSLLQLVNKLQQTCQFCQVADLLRFIETTYDKPVDSMFDNERAANLLTNCNVLEVNKLYPASYANASWLRLVDLARCIKMPV